jgi:hypothetical protein
MRPAIKHADNRTGFAVSQRPDAFAVVQDSECKFLLSASHEHRLNWLSGRG